MNEQITSRDENRNLLFGVIAWQLEFIESQQFVEAIKIWKQESRDSLDHVMVDLKMIDEPTCSLIIGLMEKQLETRGESIEASIDSKRDIISTIKMEVLALDSADAQSTLDMLKNAHNVSYEGGAGRSGRGLGRHAEASLTASRYKIVRPHAAGGLGQVSVAIDSELNREVALKELHDKHADDVDSRLRFMFEAEVTGGLEHPGIVPVYGLGMYGNGRPFYAMRFIRGESLKEAIDTFHEDGKNRESLGRENVELRRLLNRFGDICNAIEYAHSQGVLHRDLKPANVMLGKFGETLVVDWGLSKLYHSDEEDSLPTGDDARLLRNSKANETQMGAIVGTPTFMSPEQASGEHSKMGPWSDVYSLGATLYYLLSSQTPHGNANPIEVIDQVKKGAFQPLSNCTTKIPKPLAAICEKAMALNVEDRYTSATAIANDIEGWLADEPITAYREPVSVRSARWLRRHRSVTSSIGMAVVVSIVALTVASILLSQKNRDLQVAKDDAEFYESEATLRNEKLIDAMADIVGPVQSALMNYAGTDQTRQALLTAALKHLDEVNESFATGSRRDKTTVSALIALAEMALLLDTDQMPEASKASEGAQSSPLELAESYYITAADTASQVIQKDPTDTKAITLRAQALVGQGETLERRGMYDDALAKYEEALEIFRSISEGQDFESEALLLHAKHNVAVALDRIADVYFKKRDYKQTESFYQRALEIRREIAKRDPATMTHKRQELIANDELGDLYIHTQRLSEAAAIFETSKKEFAQLVKQFPENQRLVHDLSVAHEKAGLAHAYNRQRAQAIGEYQSALELREEILQSSPTNAEYLRSVGVTHTLLGQMQVVDAQTEAALASFNEAVKYLQSLVDRYPNDVQAKLDLALAYEDLGEHHQQTLRWEESIKVFEGARDIRDQLVVQFPDNLAHLDRSSVPHLKLGDSYEALEELDAALAEYQRFEEISILLASQPQADSETQRMVSLSHEKIGNIQTKLGDYSSALESYREALSISEQLYSASGGPQEKFDLGYSYSVLADCMRLAGQLSEAEATYKLAFDIRSEMVRDFPNSREVKAKLAETLAGQGEVAMELGRYAQALRSFREAFNIFEPLALEDQADNSRQYELSKFQVQIARAYAAMGDFTSEVSSLESALQNESMMLSLGMQDEIAGWKALRDEATANRLAVGNWEKIEPLDENEKLAMIARRLSVQLRIRQFDQAIETLDQWDAIGVTDADRLYDLAKAHGQLINAFNSSDTLTEQQRSDEIKRQQPLAIEKLREAIESGFSDLDAVSEAIELQSLRELPEFQRLMDRCSCQQSNLIRLTSPAVEEVKDPRFTFDENSWLA